MYEALIVSVKPPHISMSGIGEWVEENTEVEVYCDVDRVKPASEYKITWKKGINALWQQLGTRRQGTNKKDKSEYIRSTYKHSFSRSDHLIGLFCRTSGIVANRTIKVGSEYQYVT